MKAFSTLIKIFVIKTLILINSHKGAEKEFLSRTLNSIGLKIFKIPGILLHFVPNSNFLRCIISMLTLFLRELYC